MFSRKPKPTRMQSLDELGPMLKSGKPVLLDFMQVGCSPCQVMDGIVNELAREYGESAHIVKVDVGRVPGAIEVFKIRSTPTFVLLSNTTRKATKKKASRNGQGSSASSALAPRWRTTGLVKKDQLRRVLESNGAANRG